MLVEIVDRENRPIGVAERRDVLARGHNFRTVHLLAFNTKRQVLAQVLVGDHPRSPGRLGSSVAGYVASGEGYEEACRRKMREELGGELSVTPVGVFPMSDEASLKFVGVFRARIDKLPPMIDPMVAEWRWIGVDELMMLARNDSPALTRTLRFVINATTDRL